MDSMNGDMETCGKIDVSGSLKHKLNLLENAIGRITNEIKFQKREVEILTSEKSTLEQVLDQKAKEVKQSMENEVNRWDSELRSKFKESKSLNNKIQQDITMLKQEKTTLQQNILMLQRKAGELELVVGQQK